MASEKMLEVASDHGPGGTPRLVWMTLSLSSQFLGGLLKPWKVVLTSNLIQIKII